MKLTALLLTVHRQTAVVLQVHNDHYNDVNKTVCLKFSSTDQWNTTEDVAIFELFMGQKYD